MRVLFLLFILSTTYAQAKPLPVDTILDHAENVLKFPDPKLLASIAKVESSWNPAATNHHKGITYYGLMQISYGTAHMMGYRGKPQDLMNWKINIKWASKYLQYLSEEHLTYRDVVASYNAGTVIMCKYKCPKGHLVNEKYVKDVMSVYNILSGEGLANGQVFHQKLAFKVLIREDWKKYNL